jgi:hypothetical protein
MADPISAAATAFAQYVALAVFSSAGGASLATAATLANAAYVTAYAAAYVGLTATVTLGLSAIARSQLPDVEGQKSTRKQTRPVRVQAIGGPSRMSGAYMLRESRGNKLGVVIACMDGRLAYVDRYYLNDTQVTVSAGFVQGMDGERYGSGDLVRMEVRLGLPTETHYGFLTSDFGAEWPTTSRGDGVTSIGLWAQHRSRESFPRHFPDGEPIPGIVGPPVCYDWRDPAQDREDEATWDVCWNPVVWLVHVEWARHGRSWDRCIAPVLEALTVEADYCDVVPDGASEARYRCAGNYPVNTTPQAVREGLLATMDGWLSVDGRGRIVIKAGRYEDPIFTIPAEQIQGYSWRAFQTDEEAVNALIASYVSADHDYSEVEAGTWFNEDDIEARGVERSESLSLSWCPSARQTVALARRKGIRMGAARRGTVTTGIYGLNGLGQRFIRVQNPELTSMADVIVEVTKVEMDLANAQVTFEILLADPSIDDDDGDVTAPATITAPAYEPGLQQPAVVPINKSADFPISATVGEIEVEAFTIVLPNGASHDLPDATITVDDSARNGLFWRSDVGYEVEAWPATAHMSTGSWIFLGWQDSPDSGGTFPDRPIPPEGWGGGSQQEVLP